MSIETARENFARSFAAYSIVCYLMNVKDRLLLFVSVTVAVDFVGVVVAAAVVNFCGCVCVCVCGWVGE